jgi:hypothetical protein
MKLEDERRALQAFVSKIDALGLGAPPPSRQSSKVFGDGGARNRTPLGAPPTLPTIADESSGERVAGAPSLLLEETAPAVDEWPGDEASFG